MDKPSKVSTYFNLFFPKHRGYIVGAHIFAWTWWNLWLYKFNSIFIVEHRPRKSKKIGATKLSDRLVARLLLFDTITHDFRISDTRVLDLETIKTGF